MKNGRISRRDFLRTAAATTAVLFFPLQNANSLAGFNPAGESTEQNKKPVSMPLNGGIIFSKNLVGQRIEILEISNKESSPRTILERGGEYWGGFALDVRGNNIAISPSGYTQLPSIEIWGIQERYFAQLRASYLGYGLDSVCLTPSNDVQIATSSKFCSDKTHYPLLRVKWSDAINCSLEALTEGGSLGMDEESLDMGPKVSPDGSHVLYKYEVRPRCRHIETYNSSEYPQELRLVDIRTGRNVPLRMDGNAILGREYVWLSPQNFAIVRAVERDLLHGDISGNVEKVCNLEYDNKNNYLVLPVALDERTIAIVTAHDDPRSDRGFSSIIKTCDVSSGKWSNEIKVPGGLSELVCSPNRDCFAAIRSRPSESGRMSFHDYYVSLLAPGKKEDVLYSFKTEVGNVGLGSLMNLFWIPESISSHISRG